ncbi:prolyl oligopeptidase family serine peptidase [Bergeyella zoohelcum]|uniref:prolyl oligopeptidase n=1 Tax=Bergeyella zoohelcum TaxID=1015 RepID=A0A7Z8YQ33_9FLAO|nr:prolyl oligopeptidase family serine peptidase [Bergeyella zoohelcum]VDH03460.1 Prolyl endopeptidase precursor [Bergeyella zoohelcum]
MYRKYLGIAAGIALVSCASNSGVKKSNMNYPSTKTVAHTDVYFGTEVKDPYRWLEDDRSAETKQWVKEQSEFTEKYLAKIPFREQMRKELRAIWNYEKVSAPFKEGKYEYFYKNDGLQPQAVLYRKSADGKTEVFLDPNTMSKDGTTSLSRVSFTQDGSLVAYAISEGGSDWVKIITMDVATKKIIGEPILAKFSGASWLNNEGFFYSKYDQPKDGSMLSGMTDMHQVYFHKLGTPSSQDKRIIGGKDFKRRYLYVSVTDDQDYLILSGANATYGNEIYIRKASDKKGKFIPVQTGYKQSTNIIDNDGDTFYAITDKDAPNKKLVKFNLKNPSQWTTVIPETENVLSISTGGGYLFAKYIKDAVSYVIQYDYNGRKIREISLPGKGTAGGFSGKKTEKNIYFSFSNYIMPSTTYSYHVENGTSDLYYRPNVKFNPDDYVSEQVFFTSKDGTRIPMMISYKKGLKKDGKNPTILYGYGGFNISLTPNFSVVNAIWMENGGIYAVPNLRGGGEYGKKWHVAGTKMQKRNVFEDFIAAGEYLQKNGYTSPNYMALSGRSNGGLLVGATMTMRPDLAKVAFPGVGVLDMLRYNQFTAGAGWAYDYGTAQDSKEMFEYLKGYSPVHNVHEGVCYPSTMVITGDHDDRVVPAHSFKFGAELQKKQACSSPTLMRIEINAGHGAGRSTEQVIGENTDLLSFALYEMGIKALPKKK